jgi:hypothetical protein
MNAIRLNTGKCISPALNISLASIAKAILADIWQLVCNSRSHKWYSIHQRKLPPEHYIRPKLLEIFEEQGIQIWCERIIALKLDVVKVDMCFGDSL